jgi:arylformamidase
VDPATDKSLASHKAIYESDMAILEGIVLTHVPEGLYQLIALPLRIEGADASPVRAILMKEKL